MRVNNKTRTLFSLSFLLLPLIFTSRAAYSKSSTKKRCADFPVKYEVMGFNGKAVIGHCYVGKTELICVTEDNSIFISKYKSFNHMIESLKPFSRPKVIGQKITSSLSNQQDTYTYDQKGKLVRHRQVTAYQQPELQSIDTLTEYTEWDDLLRPIAAKQTDKNQCKHLVNIKYNETEQTITTTIKGIGNEQKCNKNEAVFFQKIGKFNEDVYLDFSASGMQKMVLEKRKNLKIKKICH